MGRKDRDNHFVGYTYKRKSSSASAASAGRGPSDIGLGIPGSTFASGSSVGVPGVGSGMVPSISEAGPGAHGAEAPAAAADLGSSERVFGSGSGPRSGVAVGDSRRGGGKGGLTGIFGGRKNT